MNPKVIGSYTFKQRYATLYMIRSQIKFDKIQPFNTLFERQWSEKDVPRI